MSDLEINNTAPFTLTHEHTGRWWIKEWDWDKNLVHYVAEKKDGEMESILLVLDPTKEVPSLLK